MTIKTALRDCECESKGVGQTGKYCSSFDRSVIFSKEKEMSGYRLLEHSPPPAPNSNFLTITVSC